MPHLFEPLSLRQLTFRNRIVVSPMCQYSCTDGLATDWHLVHLGSRAVGGAGLVVVEATAVVPEGRISPDDMGIWSDAHVLPLRRVVDFIHSQGTLAGLQIAHAGRKGSTHRPWSGRGAISERDGGWQPVGPTDQPFDASYPVPRPLTIDEIAGVVQAFGEAARRASDAGFDVVEIHAAHGYLIHEFLSPLVNTRTDAYGGNFDHRIKLCLEVTDRVRTVWGSSRPLFVRISSTDWAEGGWTIDEAVELGRRLRAHGVDLIDCSSGGNLPHAQIPLAPSYQVPFAERIRREAGIPTGAVGLITEPRQADAIIREERADCVLLARELLRDPYWPLRAAQILGHTVPWPSQYLRAAPKDTPGR